MDMLAARSNAPVRSIRTLGRMSPAKRVRRTAIADHRSFARSTTGFGVPSCRYLLASRMPVERVRLPLRLAGSLAPMNA